MSMPADAGMPPPFGCAQDAWLALEALQRRPIWLGWSPTTLAARPRLAPAAAHQLLTTLSDVLAPFCDTRPGLG